MGFLPKLRNTSAPAKVENVRFYGLDRNECTVDGFFSDMGNMTSRDYPFISSRKARYISKIPEGMKLIGLSGSEKIYFVINDGVKSYFYYGGQRVGEWEDSDGREKHFCENGRYIYIFPDRKYYRMRDDDAIERYYIQHADKSALTGNIVAKFEVDDGDFSPRPMRTSKLTVSGGHAFFRKGDHVKIWGYDEDSENKKAYCGIPIDKTLEVTGNNTFGGICILKTACNSNGFIKPDDLVSDYSKNFIELGYEFTHPADYDAEFGEFASSSPIRISHLFRKEDDESHIYLIIDDKQLRLDAGETMSPIELMRVFKNNFESGMMLSFSAGHETDAGTEVSDDDFLSENGIPDSGIIEECGFMRFEWVDYYEEHAYFKIAVSDSFWKTKIYNATTFSGYWYSNKQDDRWYFCGLEGDNITPHIYVELTDFPIIDGAVSAGNRMWAYSGDTIYASSLGKPYSMTQFRGISTDSWSLELGQNRSITGVIAYNSVPHFFTENGIIKIYGETVSSFRTVRTECEGVKSGCGSSLILCGGVLYYLSPLGNIMAYTGSYPSVISKSLNRTFTRGIGADDGRYIYYILSSDKGKTELYFFDTFNGIWLCDGTSDAQFLCTAGENLVLAKSNTIISSNRMDTAYETFAEGAYESFLEFTVNDEGIFNQKKLKKILLKINAENGTSLKVEVRETDSPEYMRVFERVIKEGDGVLTIPVPCKRTLGYSIRISGRGQWRLEGIMRRISIGSYKE